MADKNERGARATYVDVMAQLHAACEGHEYRSSALGFCHAYVGPKGATTLSACVTLVDSAHWVVTRCVDGCWVAVGEREDVAEAVALALSEDFDIGSLRATIPELVGKLINLENKVAALEYRLRSLERWRG